MDPGMFRCLMNTEEILNFIFQLGILEFANMPGNSMCQVEGNLRFAPLWNPEVIKMIEQLVLLLY